MNHVTHVVGHFRCQSCAAKSYEAIGGAVESVTCAHCGDACEPVGPFVAQTDGKTETLQRYHDAVQAIEINRMEFAVMVEYRRMN